MLHHLNHRSATSPHAPLRHSHLDQPQNFYVFTAPTSYNTLSPSPNHTSLPLATTPLSLNATLTTPAAPPSLPLASPPLHDTRLGLRHWSASARVKPYTVSQTDCSRC